LKYGCSSDNQTFLILLGPPGAGKGTLSHVLVTQHGWLQFSTGNECRKHISQGTEIGKQIDFAIKSGKLVDDLLITELVAHWVRSQTDSFKVILDGYPRTVPQAKLFFEFLRDYYPHTRVDIVSLDVPDNVVIKRLTSRLVCNNKECQAVYSDQENSSSGSLKNISCDVCGASLYRRVDDTAETISSRLNTYHEHVHELLSFIKGQGFDISHISADQEISDVVHDFMRVLGIE